MKLVSILEVYDDLYDWRYQSNIERIFSELLAPAESGFTAEQQTARKKVLSLLQAMKSGRRERGKPSVGMADVRWRFSSELKVECVPTGHLL